MNELPELLESKPRPDFSWPLKNKAKPQKKKASACKHCKLTPLSFVVFTIFKLFFYVNTFLPLIFIFLYKISTIFCIIIQKCANFQPPTFSHIHTPHQPQSTNHNRNVQCAHNLPLFCPLKLHKPCGHSSFPAVSQNYHQELQQHALHPEACLQIPVQLDQFR